MNILDRSQNMKRASSNKGGEYHGPCPICTPADKVGTSNRMHIWPLQDDGRGSWWCRSCDKGGDALQWLRDVEGMTYKQACASVGKEYDPKLDSSEPSAVEKKKTFVAAAEKTTDAIWQERAVRFITWSHETLRSDPGLLEWLAVQRGISYETVKELQLGYNGGENGKDIYRPRAAWGLPEALREDGKAKKLWLPVGITIPWQSNGAPARIRIRRPEGEPRYYVVPGSSGTPMLLDATPRRAWKTIIVVESELDAIMLHSQAGHLAAYLAMGSSHTKPDAAVIGQLLEQQRGKGQAIQIRIALDNDAAGAKGAAWWVETFGAALHPVPAPYKDPGEAYQGGVDLLQWVTAALPAAYHIGQQAPVAGSAAASLKNEPPPLNQSMTDRRGRTYTLTDSREIYREKQQAGEVVFSKKEMADCVAAVDAAGDQGEKLADLIMEAKNVFPGSHFKFVEE